MNHSEELTKHGQLEKEMATHSSILARRSPWAEEPEGYSLGNRKEVDMT